MAARRHPLADLSIDRNLRRFVLQGRPTGKVLGTGSYGTVEEVMNLQIKHNVLFGYSPGRLIRIILLIEVITISCLVPRSLPRFRC